MNRKKLYSVIEEKLAPLKIINPLFFYSVDKCAFDKIIMVTYYFKVPIFYHDEKHLFGERGVTFTIPTNVTQEDLDDKYIRYNLRKLMVEIGDMMLFRTFDEYGIES